jgi:type I restriction enzyme S subunit
LAVSPAWWSQIEKYNNVGAIFDSLRCADVPRFELPIPPLTDQEAIAATLGSLDDKIDLNRRMSETLEAMARTIFKDWFVDFGPTRAKMEGGAPYLAPEIWSLFPHLLDNEGKPQGWRIEPLLQHARLISGGTPRTDVEAYWNGSIAWASAKDVSQCAETFLIATDRSITERGLNESATRIVPKLATVVVARGATTGRFCMFGRAMAINQTCYALASLQGRDFWLNCAFASLIESVVHAAHGSVFDTITTNTIQAARATIADPALLDHFEAIVSPLLNRVLANIEESGTLATTRDLLLPKLMSGEIRVRDAEKIAEAAQ